MGETSKIPPPCPYCGKDSVLVDTEKFYGTSFGWAWECEPCKARVGCHKGTQKPLGRLANVGLRMAKMKAHEAFDKIWKSKQLSRNAAYRWLAGELGIHRDDCHIGMFDIETCEKVVLLSKQKEAILKAKGLWEEV